MERSWRRISGGSLSSPLSRLFHFAFEHGADFGSSVVPPVSDPIIVTVVAALEAYGHA